MVGVVHGRGHVWWGVHGRGVNGRGVCMQDRWPLKRAVRVLLECILVFFTVIRITDKMARC